MKHSIGITVPANTLTEVFTVPNGYVAEMDMLYLSNHTNQLKKVSAYWQHAHDVDHKIYIIYQKDLNAKEFFQFGNGSVVFQAGDSLQVLTETGSDYTVIVTFDLRKESVGYNFPNN